MDIFNRKWKTLFEFIFNMIEKVFGPNLKPIHFIFQTLNSNFKIFISSVFFLILLYVEINQSEQKFCQNNNVNRFKIFITIIVEIRNEFSDFVTIHTTLYYIQFDNTFRYNTKIYIQSLNRYTSKRFSQYPKCLLFISQFLLKLHYIQWFLLMALHFGIISTLSLFQKNWKSFHFSVTRDNMYYVLPILQIFCQYCISI